MRFPSKILPNRFRKKINCDLSQHVLIRYTNTADINELIDPLTGLLKDKFICDPSEHVSDLSTNLFGVFKKNHLFIELTQVGKESYNHYCEPNTNVASPKFKVDYTLNTNRHFWTLNVGKVHNTIAVYQRSNVDMEAICLVEHSPMLWNFWHFSIRWKTDEGIWHGLPDKQKKNLSRRLKHEARTHIKFFARLEEPINIQIKKSCYENNKPSIIKNIVTVFLFSYLFKKLYKYFFIKKNEG